MGDEHDGNSSQLDTQSAPIRCCSYAFWIATAEVAAIVVLFFVYAGHPAPDVNEAHYLTKAKHFWQTDWCEGDTFLESADAHLVFYWTAGWLTKYFSLATTAWIGRVVSWVLLAVTWHRFLRCFTAKPGYSLLAAGMALCLWDRFHLAGEWVVGGFEAKGFAMACLFVALRFVALNQWGRAFVALGAASSFHVLVGGWGVVGVAIALALQWKSEQLEPTRIVGGLIGGGLLALPGLLPALWLTGGVASETKQQAAEIYVDRLGHHLEIYRMAPERIGLFGLVLAVWVALYVFRRPAPAVRRVQAIALASVGIGVVGWALDYFSIVLPVVDRLLRYYFFRLSDIAVPLGVVVFVIDWLKEPKRELAMCVIILAVAGTITFGFLTSTDRQVPPAFIQGLGRDLTTPELKMRWRDWQDTCHWIDERIPLGSRCLTPTISQTFCWYANRPEVAVWKNIPQDAESILEWRHTMDQIFLSYVYPKPNTIDPPATVDPSDLAAELDFEYLIATERPRISWPEAYRNRTYIVYRNPHAASRTRTDEETD